VLTIRPPSREAWGRFVDAFSEAFVERDRGLLQGHPYIHFRS
jgi:hypothetical protein